MKKTFKVQGMSCSVCAGHVEKAALGVAGVDSAVVNLTANTVRLLWDENVTDEQKIAAAINSAGYELIVEAEKKDGKDSRLKTQLAGLITSVVLLLPLMYLSMGVQRTFLNVFLQFVLCLPVVIINFRFFRRGIPLLLKCQPNMDTLIAVGSGSAFLYSIFATVMLLLNEASTHSVYFETAAMILTLVSVGKYLEARAKSRTGETLEKLNSLVPKAADIKVGDTILVREGVLIPADGVVVSGGGIVDESGLTGESVPVDKVCGDEVKAGTLNIRGVFKMSVTGVGEDTVISKMVALVQDAAATKAPIARLADKVSSVFVPVVMLIALVTGVVWFVISKDFETALKMCVTVLVVSCPCSLGLATPVAVTAAIYKSAEQGILVKSAAAFELLEKCDTVVLDKTGTVTMGKPSVFGVRPWGNALENDIIEIAASLESASNHPFAAAFEEAAKKRGINVTPAESYENVLGRGISGNVKGTKYFIGNLKFASEVLNNKIPEEACKTSENEASKGFTPLLVFSESELLGFCFVADTIKPEAVETVCELKKRGKSVIMLTGDNAQTAAAISKTAGIGEFKAGVLPHEKEAFVRELAENGRQAIMVGDGINDSAALTRARVGVAMGSGTDIAIESADCVLLKNSLYDIINLIDVSHFALRIIKQNLFWALFYNCLCIPAAAGVLMPWGIGFSPMFASAAMSISSLIVVTNALRIMRMEKCDAKISYGGDKIMKYELKIEGMMCVKCKAHVEKALAGVAGVKSVLVSLEENSAVCECDGSVSKETLEASVIEAGYEVV